MSRAEPGTPALDRLRARAAFTLTELLIAVGVLVVVIVASAQIFASASKVSAVAEANADLLQTAAAIESQVRADFENLPKNGFLVLQQVEVNPPGGTTSPDPDLPTAEIRADQVAFFTRGVRTTTQYTGSQNVLAINGVAREWLPESAVARVYYGHGYLATTVPVGFGPTFYEDSNAPPVPWKSGRVETERWDTGQIGAAANIPPVKSSQWPLVRMATLMGTDGVINPRYANASVNASIRLFASRSVRLGPLSTAYPTVYDPLWTSGRVDICKWQPDDLFSQMAYQPAANQSVTGIPFLQPPNAVWSLPSSRLRMIQTLAPWAVPATSVSPQNGGGQLYISYPRVEKAALGAAKSEQMLSAPILAANCSSFKVEWTWADGVGRDVGVNTGGPNPNANAGIGMFVGARATQPWFGLDVPSLPLGQNAVRPLSNFRNWRDDGAGDLWGTIGLPLVYGRGGVNPTDDLVTSVEGIVNRSSDSTVENRPVWKTGVEQGSKRVYQAVFGFNQDDPSEVNPGAFGRGPYTPLPSALRITIRLHDPLGRIEGGREFQFIVDLPKR